jgi:hypothetical protein
MTRQPGKWVRHVKSRPRRLPNRRVGALSYPRLAVAANAVTRRLILTTARLDFRLSG